jgi:hypothetical protein
MKSSMVRKNDVRATVVAVERVMKPLHDNENEASREVTVFKPHHQTESQYFEAKEPQDLRHY